MNLWDKIRRYSAMNSGDFDKIFQEVELPQLPASTIRLVAECNKKDPDFDKLAQVLSSAPSLSAKVLKLSNSAHYNLSQPVTNVKLAISLLGLKQIRSLAFTLAAQEGLPKPKGGLFDVQAFWTDSLVKALLARSFCAHIRGGDPEDCFTAGLLADMALPVLLTAWSDYYAPVIKKWKGGSRRLSDIEREAFGWDHARAGAWMAKKWGFPEEIGSLIGIHNLSIEKVKELGIANTVALPLALASLAPSTLNIKRERIEIFIRTAQEALKLDTPDMLDILKQVEQGFGEVARVLGVSGDKGGKVIRHLETVTRDLDRKVEGVR